MSIELIITGGQSGSDQAGWRAARAAGIPTGGWMPKKFRTEGRYIDDPNVGRHLGPDEFHPEFAGLYGAKEHASSAYPPRTRRNIGDADVTLVFAVHEFSSGTRLAIGEAGTIGRPCRVVKMVPGPIPPGRPAACAGWLRDNGFRVLNVAGNRESSAPGIGAWVEEYLTAVFAAMKATMHTEV